MQKDISPFIFGRKAIGESFTDREAETAHLVANFRNRVNTVLISPRRWGKSSLVKKAGDLAQSPKLKVIYLDAFTMRDATDFYTTLANAVLKTTYSTLEGWIEQAKRFFTRITPRFSFGNDPMNSLELSFELEAISKNYEEILSLPEKVAIEKGIHFVICIDEFQNTSLFSEHSLFHKRLRSVWQDQQHVTYCIYGSKQHMMISLFEKQSMPFYRFGETIHLGKISLTDWVLYIEKQFKKTAKTITPFYAEAIAKNVNCHSYYVQQLAHLVWQRTQNAVEDEIITSAVEDLINQNELLYLRDTEMLSETQLNFLIALASGVTDGFSRKDILQKYKLGSSANVSRIKTALIEKEMIDLSGRIITFLDPAYALWFAKRILKKETFL